MWFGVAVGGTKIAIRDSFEFQVATSAAAAEEGKCPRAITVAALTVCPAARPPAPVSFCDPMTPTKTKTKLMAARSLPPPPRRVAPVPIPTKKKTHLKGTDLASVFGNHGMLELKLLIAIKAIHLHL